MTKPAEVMHGSSPISPQSDTRTSALPTRRRKTRRVRPPRYRYALTWFYIIYIQIQVFIFSSSSQVVASSTGGIFESSSNVVISGGTFTNVNPGQTSVTISVNNREQTSHFSLKNINDGLRYRWTTTVWQRCSRPGGLMSNVIFTKY